MRGTTVTVALLGSLLAGASMAQTTTTPAQPVSPGSTSVNPSINPSTGVAPGTGIIDRNSGPAAAAGNRNQAVATTSANAPQPAKGANSFTAGEARGRMERNGFAEIASLKKDSNGIWRGTAKKNGNPVKVWLDYKGNIGTF